MLHSDVVMWCLLQSLFANASICSILRTHAHAHGIHAVHDGERGYLLNSLTFIAIIKL